MSTTMKLSTSFFALVALPFAFTAPTNTIQERSTTQCGQWDSITTGGYILYQDLWNEATGTGSQCSTLDSVSGDTIAWSTSWSWAGASNQVKSYANAVVQFTSAPLRQIGSIPTTWAYSYTGTSIVADVSYDTFLGPSASGSASYEIMIWLAALGGAGPISSTGSPIATPTLNGHPFKLYRGPNGATTVFSFVAVSEITTFSGDLMDFFDYLISSQGVSSALYLQSIGAGTEPFTGSDAVLTVRGYSAQVLGVDGVVQATSPVSSSIAPSSTKVAVATSTPIVSPTRKPTKSTSAVAPSITPATLGTAWAQCGGVDFSGPTSCVAGYSCVESSQWYSQCVPASSL